MAEEMSFEQMLNESLKSVRSGEIVEGTVVEVSPSEAVVNIGFKFDGYLAAREYSNERDVDLTTKLNVGDKVEVKVVKIDNKEGTVTVSMRQAAAEKASKIVEDAFNNHTPLTAKVTQIMKGGICADVDGTRVFIPASLISDTFERDLTKYQDQEITFLVTEFNPRRRRIIGDRKQLVAAEHAKAKEDLLANLTPGDVIEGTVRNVTDFGAFIDLGSADGLLHVSEMGWGRTGNPKKLFKAGEKVRVFVKEINGDRIALSRKFPDEDPWIGADEKYGIGMRVTGKVARMADFGAFIELEPGIDGLLHVSQISRQHIDKPSDVLKTGQEVEVLVTGFDPEAHKISLSMKDLLPEDEAETVVSTDNE